MWLFKISLVLFGLGGSFVTTLDHAAIDYYKTPVDDPVARLNQRLATGTAKLAFDPRFGYLPSVLKELKVSDQSQILVYSKTSFQAPRIAPRTPRALYFNDTISVGYVQGGDVVELAAQDPYQGVIFYTLDQDNLARPRFERRDSCLQCHQNSATLGVPGIMVRSVYPERSGMPAFQHGTHISDHRSPLEQRWGGWYVTGTIANATHMGNSITRDRESSELIPVPNRFDAAQYLTPHSDVAALLVLEHQTHATNLLTRVNFEIRHALHQQEAMNTIFKEPAGHRSESTERRIRQAAEELIDYLLFVEELPLPGKVDGSSGFIKEFASLGPFDQKGRSLRQFDLMRRIFKYPLSFLIYTEAFDRLHPMVRDAALRRLSDVLVGKVNGKPYDRLSAADRQAILEILRDTKPGLPSWFGQSS